MLIMNNKRVFWGEGGLLSVPPDENPRPAADPASLVPKARPGSLRRGAQARVPLKAAIIGGGTACKDLLDILVTDRLGLLNMEILGVADPDREAPGRVHAEELGLFTTDDLTELYDLPGLNLLIELTGSQAVREKMIKTKPLEVSSIDHRGARLLWDLVQIEIEKGQIEREADEKIKSERDWVQRIIDSLPDAIMVLDPKMRILSVNQTFVDFTGQTESQVIGRTCHEVKHLSCQPCHMSGGQCPFLEVMATKKNASVLHAHAGPKGQTLFEEVVATPILNERGEVVQVVEGSRDVTRRVRLEAELRQTEERLHQFLEAAEDLISIKDLEGHYIYANPAAAEMTGCPTEAMVGQTDFDLFPEKLAQAMVAHDRETIGHQTPQCFDETLHHDGQVRRFHTVRYPIFDHQGKVVAVSVMSHDVTQEMALQEQARRSHDYIQAVLKNSTDMILTTDLDGLIVTFNPGGERMLGYTENEIKGLSVEDIWIEAADRRRLMKEVRAKGSVNNYPATLLAKNGEHVDISLSLALLRAGDGRILGTVGISKDVTEENRLRRQLIESERLAAIGETVAGLAHCIKNILNGLKGGSYLLNTGLARQKPELIEEGWQSVERNIARISDLSLDMLSYVRDRKPELTEADPQELVGAVLAQINASVRMEGVNLVSRVEPGPPVQLDLTAMNRVLVNLIQNAVDACREKEYPPGRSPEVRIEVARPGGEVRIAVIDNGVGLTDEVKDQLFTRFFTTKEARGTGLGLAVCHKLVSESGGRITVESEPGQGATFTVILPAAPAAAGS
jgi:PAS domain S-box-containing protein